MQEALAIIEDFITGLSNSSSVALAAKYKLSGRVSGRICPNKDGDCEALVLGTLLRSARAEGLWPAPISSFYTKTYILERLRALRVQSLCWKVSHNTPTSIDLDDGSTSHGIQEVIIAAANKLENSPKDLKLEDFK